MEALLLEDAGEIELDIRLPPNECAVAQQSERETVGDESPDVLGAIQVLLHQRMRCETRPTARGHPTQLLPGTDDVHGRRVFRLGGTMRDGERETVDLVGARVLTDDGRDLGRVKEIIPTGSNDVLVASGRYGEVLIPAIEGVVLEVDIEGKLVTVHLLEGLLPQEPEDGEKGRDEV